MPPGLGRSVPFMCARRGTTGAAGSIGSATCRRTIWQRVRCSVGHPACADGAAARFAIGPASAVDGSLGRASTTALEAKAPGACVQSSGRCLDAGSPESGHARGVAGNVADAAGIPSQSVRCRLPGRREGTTHGKCREGLQVSEMSESCP